MLYLLVPRQNTSQHRNRTSKFENGTRRTVHESVRRTLRADRIWAMSAGMSKRLLTVAEAATYVSLSVSTLNRFRVSGGGPRYVKLGGKVLYDARDLDQWIENNKRASTSDRAA
jgi:excisionase family DNA binding protein